VHKLFACFAQFAAKFLGNSFILVFLLTNNTGTCEFVSTEIIANLIVRREHLISSYWWEKQGNLSTTQ
jgi:hypothetical protein